MRIFKLKKFAKFAKKQHIGDDKLRAVVAEMEDGIVHADLGGNVFKQRVARDGQGKRSSYRVIIIYKKGERAFFIHGFLKADEASITDQEAELAKELAVQFIGLSDAQLKQLMESAEILEV